MLSGHTHRAYVCRLDGTLVTSAECYGRMVTELDLAFDARTGRLDEVKARNLPVTRDVPPDRRVQAIVDRARRRTAAAAGRFVGTAAVPLTRVVTPAGESSLGDVVADAQRSATGADLALMNPTNLRADVAAGPVTYGDLFALAPFGARLEVATTFTGAQLQALLEQQFQGREEVLQVSAGFSYLRQGDAVTAMTLGDRPVGPEDRVRVALNDFLAAGGDGFTAARNGADTETGPVDIEALTAYFGREAPVPAGPQDRIVDAG